MNTETVTIHQKGEDFEITVQHDQSGSAYGIPLSRNAYEQLRQHFVSGSTVSLDETQTAILQGKICSYCKGKTQYVDSAVIYGKSYGMIYLCKPCDAYCGVHKGTDNALGRLANKELRHWKKEAHKYFDVIWKEGHEKRGEVYKHLANHLKLPVEYCHIGMFSVKTCQEVVDWSKMILNDIRRLDMDFGVDVKRPHYECP